MRIRLFIENKDYKYLEKDAADWTGNAYVATEDDGTVIGFFCYSVNTETNAGFLKFVIVDSRKRGTGCGSAMVQLALQYAFVVTGAECVRQYKSHQNFRLSSTP